MTCRFKQRVNSVSFKHFNEQCSHYLKEAFYITTESNCQLRSSSQKLKCPFCNEQFPRYLNKVFYVATKSNFHLRTSFEKLKCPIYKTNNGQVALSYIGRTFWNKPQDTFKHTGNISIFKHNIKNIS